MNTTMTADTIAAAYPLPVLRVSVVRERDLFSSEPVKIRGPRVIAQIVASLTGGEEREHFLCFLLDNKNVIKGIVPVAVGDLNSCIVHPREVFRAAIHQGAAALIVAHNHPSGDPEPSPEDAAVTRRLKEVGELVGIALLDHIVVGDAGRFVSLAERGQI